MRRPGADLARLPWRRPFLMIDRVIECEPPRQIVTRKNVTANDALLGEQAPRAFPTVLLLEGMSQSAALLFKLSYEDVEGAAFPLLGFLRATFTEGGARTGDSIVYHVRALKMTRSGGVFEARAEVERTHLAEAELAFAAERSR